MSHRFSPYNNNRFSVALFSAAAAVVLPCFAGDGEHWSSPPYGSVGASTAEGTTAVPGGGYAGSGIEGRAIARLDEKTQAAMGSLEKARQLYQEQKYEESLKVYKSAYEVLPNVPLNKKRRDFIADSMADAGAVVAQEYISVGRYDEARTLLEGILSERPNHAYARRVMTMLEDPIRSNPAKTPQYVVNVKEVERLLLQGYGYFDLGKFDEAQKSFEAVLLIDNTNTAARRGMEQVDRRRTAYFEAARDQRRSSALVEVSKAWEEVPTSGGTPEEPGYIGGMTTEGGRSMDDKIKSLVIPRIDFDGIDLMEAVDFLRQQSVRLDEGAIASEKGVNIIVNLGDPDSETAKNVLSKKFNLNMNNVPMSEVMQYIAQATGTTVYTTAYSVEFTTDATDVPFQTKVIQLPPGFFSGASEQASGSSGGEVDPFADASASSGGLTIARVNPMEALKSMGVPFPEGASARYNAQNSTLFVYNKPQNLRMIESLVAAKASEQPLQVVVSATIIEVSETTLKELGFDWIVDLNLDTNKWFGIGGGKTGDSPATPPSIPGVPLPGYGLMTGGLRTTTQVMGTDTIDSLIQSGSSAGLGSQYKPGSAPGFFSIRGVWSQAEVAFIMRGLDQKKGVDVLQKPSTIIRPGEKVSFYAGKEIIYPEEYEPPQIPSGSDQNSGSEIGNMVVAPAHPTSFIKRETGTIFDVDVLGINEGKTIVNLALSPQIVEFDGFVNYGSPITLPAVDRSGLLGTNNLANVELSKNEILQPIFSKRGVTTSLSVETGQTVVFGGLKKAKTVEFEDKVPIFGDIPLIGRLFRSEGKEEERQVLLMFVKAEIIDPGGDPILNAVKSSTSSAFNEMGESGAVAPSPEASEGSIEEIPTDMP